MDIVVAIILTGSILFVTGFGLYAWRHYKRMQAMDEGFIEMMETIREACHEELEKIKNETEQELAMEEAKYEVKH